MMEPVLNRFKSQIDRLRSVASQSLPHEIKTEVQNQVNLFTNQYNTLTRLETRYGEALFQACQIEIDELLKICSDCVSSYSAEYNAENRVDLTNKVRENSVRLNLLQQRITGKIFKIKPDINS
ncbi:MAG: hypothetical protein SFY67_05590 [Candidatus Melainabacteria bacterium]|nr:hypothetical protein [Candidatus Melainabacteria bacterium]